MASAKELSQAAESTPLTMAVVGCAGHGKSTLVNSLLLMEPDSQDAAEAGDEGRAVTADVRCYTKIRDYATVTIWDTPGLGDSETMTSKEVLKRLYDGAGGNIDLLVFCIAYRPGVRVDDSHINIIKLLTKLFGNEIWKKALLVFTMVNTIKSKKSIPTIAQNIEKGLKDALRSAGVPEGVVSDQRLILAGLGEEPLSINENEEIDWNTDFFLYCFGVMKNPSKRATLTQTRFGRSFWDKAADALIVGGAGAGGAAAGAGLGALVGSNIGSIAVAIGFGSSAAAGASTVAAGTVGAVAGAVGTGTAVATGTAGAVAGVVGTGTAVAGVGGGALGTGAMAGAAGTTAAAGAMSAGAVLTACTGVGAVLLGGIAIYAMAKYLKSKKKD